MELGKVINKRTIRPDPIKMPFWLLKSPTDIVSSNSKQYLIIK